MTDFKYQINFNGPALDRIVITNTDSTGTTKNFTYTGDIEKKIPQIVASLNDASTVSGSTIDVNNLNGGKKKQTKKSKQRNNKTKRQRKRSFSISKSI